MRSQSWRALSSTTKRVNPASEIDLLMRYTVEREFVLILAVAHLAREPGYWKSRS